MARNVNLAIPANTWVELSNADVTEMRVQNLRLADVLLQASVGSVEPADNNGCIVLPAGSIWTPELTVAEIWPGLAGANRVWAFSSTDTVLSVSHA